jgi:predicted GH43/DUF377 family glycosyl hydrolase
MLNWRKKGLIFSPSMIKGWQVTHAQVPTVLIKDDCVRVYFAMRPKANLSLTCFVDLDKRDNSKIIRVNTEPILELGDPGMFDEHGIMPSCAVAHHGQVYLYYSGWQRCVSLPYNNYTGLAISNDGGETFSKYSKGPIIDRTPNELFSATSPEIVKKSDDEWYMFYCSGTNWLTINHKMEHTYNIKLAISKDGKKWEQLNKTIIEQSNEFEAITKPSIFFLDNQYHMLFCFRGSSDFRDGKDAYRIGYANSKDLINWHRNDEKAGISNSEEGWDSDMIAYPAVLELEQKIILFYNGNGFGEKGFGYAELIKVEK